MAVHKNSDQTQRTIDPENIVSLKMAPLVPRELFDENESDIGRLALQLLLELDTPEGGSSEFTKPGSITECFAIREKLLNLFQQQNIAEVGAAVPKLTASGRRSLHSVLSSLPRGPEMLANPSAMPTGREAASILLAIMRGHFSQRATAI